MRRTTLFALACIVLAACDDNDPMVPPNPEYEIEITNLTTGQPMAPPVVVLHEPGLDIWTSGQPADDEVVAIAENGDTDPLVTLVTGNSDVADFEVASGDPEGPLMPGETRTVTLVGSDDDTNRLTVVAMLICTNDGFTGVDALQLPASVGGSTTQQTVAYDAGSELNTETWTDIVPPCAGLTGQDNGGESSGMSNPALAENGVITGHAGIVGDSDLDAEINDWTDPVMEIVVTRTD